MNNMDMPTIIKYSIAWFVVVPSLARRSGPLPPFTGSRSGAFPFGSVLLGGCVGESVMVMVGFLVGNGVGLVVGVMVGISVGADVGDLVGV